MKYILRSVEVVEVVPLMTCLDDRIQNHPVPSIDIRTLSNNTAVVVPIVFLLTKSMAIF